MWREEGSVFLCCNVPPPCGTLRHGLKHSFLFFNGFFKNWITVSNKATSCSCLSFFVILCPTPILSSAYISHHQCLIFFFLWKSGRINLRPNLGVLRKYSYLCAPEWPLVIIPSLINLVPKICNSHSKPIPPAYFITKKNRPEEGRPYNQ